jgi:hypothetical protein
MARRHAAPGLGGIFFVHYMILENLVNSIAQE